MRAHPNPSCPNSALRSAADVLLDEGLLNIVAAAAAEGLRISSKTALRWAIHGTRGARLESVRVGGRRLTSRAAIRRFVAAQQRDTARPAPGLDAAGAERVLAAHGLDRASEVGP